MLQPALRRRLLAAATPSRLALGAGFVLGGAAAGLALHSDAGAPPEEAGLRAQTVVAEAAFNIQEAMGVNTQEQLAEIAEILQQEPAE